MSAPTIPDAIEAACKAPGLWLVEGCVVQRTRAPHAPAYWTVDNSGHHRTLQDAIDWIADERTLT